MIIIQSGESRFRLLHNTTDPELISGFHRFLSVQVYFNHLLTHHRVTFFIFQRGDDLPGLYINDLTGGGIGMCSVQAEGNPSRLVSYFDTRHLAWRHYSIIKNMHALVECVA